MERIPCDEEIKAVMWGCDPGKAPGYDVFNIRFIKECADIIGKDLTKFIKDFFVTGRFDLTINKNWVTLITKIPNPVSI